MSGLRTASGLLLMLLGMLLLGYAALLDMSHVRQTTWVERPLVVGPVGILLLLGGAALAGAA